MFAQLTKLLGLQGRRRIGASRSVTEVLENRVLLAASVTDGTIVNGRKLKVLKKDPNSARPETQAIESAANGGFTALAIVPLNQTFNLSSRPTAQKTIYLDFTGHIVSNTDWNVLSAGEPFYVGPFSLDQFPEFNSAELERIQNIWRRVAEDFAPFDVNVTTKDPGASALMRTGTDDQYWGIRCVIGDDFAPLSDTTIGVAFLNSFSERNDVPCFVFDNGADNGAEAFTAGVISHEVGHTLGLEHDGDRQGATAFDREYYGGHGLGLTSWGPIMGGAEARALTQWSKGEYLNATQQEDDLSIITNRNGFGYRPDDFPTTRTNVKSFVTNTSFTLSGVIGTRSDQDWFGIKVTAAGTLELKLPATDWSNLDAQMNLYDANGNLLVSSNPVRAIGALISRAVTPGTYYVRVDGVGEGAIDTGFSDYGSLGQFNITGNLIPTALLSDRTIDDGDTNFALTGTWSSLASGRSGDSKYTAGATTATKFARWNFTGLPAGTYNVYETHGVGPTHANNAAFRVLTATGGTQLLAQTVNQRVAPTTVIDGTSWISIGTVVITGTTITVELSNLANGRVIADAIRLVKIPARGTTSIAPWTPAEKSNDIWL